MLIAIIVLSVVLSIMWSLAAILTFKTDKILSGNRTWQKGQVFADVILALIVWPVMAFLIITTKHRCASVSKTTWEY